MKNLKKFKKKLIVDREAENKILKLSGENRSFQKSEIIWEYGLQSF